MDAAVPCRTTSTDQYRQQHYYAPGKGVEGTILAELDKMVRKWEGSTQVRICP